VATSDFLKAWAKMMILDRVDLARSTRQGLTVRQRSLVVALKHGAGSFFRGRFVRVGLPRTSCVQDSFGLRLSARTCLGDVVFGDRLPT